MQQHQPAQLLPTYATPQTQAELSMDTLVGYLLLGLLAIVAAGAAVFSG